MLLRKAAVMACSSPCETAASTTATSLSRPGKSSAGETEAFIAAILARPAVRGGGRAKPGSCQEIGDGGAEAVEIDQERVVALRRLERQEVRLRATRAQAVGDLLLLRSEAQTSELQSLMRISYSVVRLNKKINKNKTHIEMTQQDCQ